MEVKQEFADQWMLKTQLSKEERNTDYVLDIVYNFFEEKINHKFTEERLFWLVKWIGVENQKQKIEFLLSIWELDFFHPFVEPEEAADMVIHHNLKRYVISLSSTFPNMIRVTLPSQIRNGVIHRRMDVSDKDLTTSNDGFIYSKVGFNSFVMLEEINKLLKHHNPIVERKYRAVFYSDKYVNVEEEKPKPYLEI